MQRRMAELKKIQIGSVQGDHGKEGGRGHKKPLQTNSSAGVSRAGVRREIAQQAQISEHKAQQAIQVAQHAPELLDQVMTGKEKLKDAAKKARAKSPPKPGRPQRPAWNMEKQCGRVMELVRRLAAQCPAGERRQFCRWIARQCEGIV
jgi:hypothetical protein